MNTIKLVKADGTTYKLAVTDRPIMISSDAVDYQEEIAKTAIYPGRKTVHAF